MSRPTSPNTVASDVTLSPRETTVTFHCFTPSSVPSGQSPPPRPHGLMNAQPTAGGRRPLAAGAQRPDGHPEDTSRPCTSSPGCGLRRVPGDPGLGVPRAAAGRRQTTTNQLLEQKPFEKHHLLSAPHSRERAQRGSR